MSCAVSVVATPHIISPLVMGFGTAAAAAGVVALAGYGSYIAICKLRKDYQQSLTEFHEHSQADLRARIAFSEQEHSAVLAALAVANGTKVLAAEDAGMRFVQTRVTHLVQRLPQLAQPDPELAAQCAALLLAVEEQPLELSAHFEQYRLLAERAATLFAEQADDARVATTLSEELAAIREEMDSPLLAGDEYTDLREQLQQQFAALEAVLAGHRDVAKQGLVLLRRRLHRELQMAADHRQVRIRQAEEIRLQVGESLARLQAILRQEQLPDFNRAAALLLERLSETLSRATANDNAEIRQVAVEVDALFTACAKTFEEQTIAAYLEDQISEALTTMGYQVSQLPPEGLTAQRALVAAVGDDLGLEFHVDGHGRLGTEMVALSEDAASAGHDAQERVCTLVDQVFAALNAHECAIRERFRSSLRPGEQLRVVEMPASEDASRPVKAELKKMQVE